MPRIVHRPPDDRQPSIAPLAPLVDARHSAAGG